MDYPQPPIFLVFFCFVFMCCWCFGEYLRHLLYAPLLASGGFELSTKMIRHYRDGIRERKEWWKICEILKKSIGRNMMRRRRKPAPFIPSYLPH
ncbi:hypothetical protein HRbin02_01904 [Candidatus Calditenuaceae archaeon HR02]|nr:hypothetical protein HRbin02_01904 [Candidatus Calditenuaceae archaeon HR02]